MLDRPTDNPDAESQDAAVWSFPSRSRCPDCGSLATLATSTQGLIQRRRCTACGHRYKVVGEKV